MAVILGSLAGALTSRPNAGIDMSTCYEKPRTGTSSCSILTANDDRHKTTIAMRLFLLPISTRRTLIYCEKATSGTPQSLSDRIINKASTTWTGWEKAESGWQKQLTRYGNQLFRRIPFEEWGLKTLPPLSQQTSTNPSQLKVLYPSLFMQTSKVPVTLDQIATERQGFHRKKLIWSVVAMPFSIPFALVPMSVDF